MTTKLVAVAVAALIVSLAACSSSQSAGNDKGTSVPPTPSSSEAAPSPIPSPNAQQQKALQNALRKAGVRSDEHLVSHARNVCQYVQNGESAGTIRKYVASEFNVSGSKATKVIAAVKSSFCH